MQVKSIEEGFDSNLIESDKRYVAYKTYTCGIPVCIKLIKGQAIDILEDHWLIPHLWQVSEEVMRQIYSEDMPNRTEVWGSIFHNEFHIHYMVSAGVLLPWDLYYHKFLDKSSFIFHPRIYHFTGSSFKERYQQDFFEGAEPMLFLHPFEDFSSYIFVERRGSEEFVKMVS